MRCSSCARPELARSRSLASINSCIDSLAPPLSGWHPRALVLNALFTSLSVAFELTPRTSKALNCCAIAQFSKTAIKSLRERLWQYEA